MGLCQWSAWGHWESPTIRLRGEALLSWLSFDCIDRDASNETVNVNGCCVCVCCPVLFILMNVPPNNDFYTVAWNARLTSISRRRPGFKKVSEHRADNSEFIRYFEMCSTLAANGLMLRARFVSLNSTPVGLTNAARLRLWCASALMSTRRCAYKLLTHRWSLCTSSHRLHHLRTFLVADWR